MSENYERYQRALARFDRAIRAVPADRWEAQSPCTEWKTRDVAGHVIGVQRMVTGMLTETPATGERPAWREFAGDDPVAAWTKAHDALTKAAVQEGALDTKAATPFGEMTVDDFLGILVLDAITHTWDLSRAAGIDDRLDPELVSLAFERIRPLDAAIRGPGFFEPAKDAPEGADEQTELMAFLGRQV